MQLTVVRLLAFDGPNMCSPHPGVLLEALADQAYHMQLRAILKQGAQRAGIVIGYLEADAWPLASGYMLRVFFATPQPQPGRELAQIASMILAGQDDPDQDSDELWWQLQRQRRALALPVAAVQLLANAAAHGLPAFVRQDGRIQIGFGASGASFDHTLAVGALPWEQLGTIPLIACTGTL